MKFYVIGDKDTIIGFSLAGIKGIEATTEIEARRGLEYAINSKETGIILITERLAHTIQPMIDELLFKKESLVILPIPDSKGNLPTGRSIEEFVLSAVGVKL
jgi:V/A-type H+-transporting ATPase subunit F